MSSNGEQFFFCDDGGSPQATDSRAKDTASVFWMSIGSCSSLFKGV